MLQIQSSSGRRSGLSSGELSLRRGLAGPGLPLFWRVICFKSADLNVNHTQENTFTVTSGLMSDQISEYRGLSQGTGETITPASHDLGNSEEWLWKERSSRESALRPPLLLASFLLGLGKELQVATAEPFSARILTWDRVNVFVLSLTPS